MEDQRPSNETIKKIPGIWGGKGKRRMENNRAGFITSKRGKIRLGNVANLQLTITDFGISPSILRGKEDDQ